MWIKRLLTKESNFTNVAQLNSKIFDYHKFFTHNMSRTYLVSQPTLFYSQILDYWEEVRNSNLAKMGINEILNEKLCHNKHILLDNKPFTNSKLSTNDINIIHDILKPDLSIKQPNELSTLTIMEYNQIISAIPKEWKTKINLSKNSNAEFKVIHDLEIKIGLTHKHLLRIRCKDFYWHLINKIHETPTAVLKWEELYYYVDFNWNNIFTLPYVTTSETVLQSMQYQIINRYFPCKSCLSTWHTDLDKLCTLCHVEETLEHYFFHCTFVKPFWNHFFVWWNRISHCNLNLGAIDVIFGLMNEENQNSISVLNYCIVLAKKYIIDCRTKDVNCSFDMFCTKLKNRLVIEEYIATINCKRTEFMHKWNFVMNHLD